LRRLAKAQDGGNDEELDKATGAVERAKNTLADSET
jgi:hypothetical protein